MGSLEQQPPAGRRPFLWRIEGHRPSWLFGTIHVPDPRAFELPAAAEDAFAASDLVVTERKLSLLRLVGESLRAGCGRRPHLRHRLPRQLYERLVAHVASFGHSMVAFNRQKLWFIGLALLQLWYQQHGSGATILDRALWLRARREGKRTWGLETSSESFTALDALADGDQIAMLRHALDAYDRHKSAGEDPIEVFLQGWMSGDERRLWSLLAHWDGGDEALRGRMVAALLSERNARWAPRLATRLRDDPDRSTFVAVGTLHLLGPRSLPELLGREGFTVHRI